MYVIVYFAMFTFIDDIVVPYPIEVYIFVFKDDIFSTNKFNILICLSCRTFCLYNLPILENI